MADYYTIIGVAPNASPADIQNAIEAQYNQVRRLTTHHDPQVVNQANQALLVLEKARTTLLNPENRSVYDAAIGINAPAFGGLADPGLIGFSPGPQNPGYPAVGYGQPAPSSSQGFGGVGQQAGISQHAPAMWVCQSCQYANPPGTLFCQNCAQPVGRVCPNCQASYEAKVKFCPSCGMAFESAARRGELNNIITQKKVQRLSLADRANATSSSDLRYLEYLGIGGMGWSAYLGISAVLLIVESILGLILSAFQRSAGLTSVTVFIFGLFTLLRWISWAGVLAGAYFFTRRPGSSFNLPAIFGYGIVSLLAVLISGASTNLVFPAIVAAVLIGWGAYLTRARSVGGSIVNLIPRRFTLGQTLAYQLQQNYQKSPIVLAGVGIVLSIVVAYLTASTWLLCLLGSILCLGVFGILAVIAYRAWNLVEVEKKTFLTRQAADRNALTQLDAEITNMEQEFNALSVRR